MCSHSSHFLLQSLQWPVIHALILDIVIAMSPLNLPAYILLWIIDWFPYLERRHTEYRKVTHIIRIIESIRRVWQRRIDNKRYHYNKDDDSYGNKR